MPLNSFSTVIRRFTKISLLIAVILFLAQRAESTRRGLLQKPLDQ